MAGFLIVTSMFYTRREQTARVGYFCKGAVINYLLFPFLFFNSSNEWNWYERSQVYIPLQALIDVSAQIIFGFISFGTLHIHTSGFEPWQWYDQVQHLTIAFIFL